jgi:AbrB family looped-hinge helix DNA binding protein
MARSWRAGRRIDALSHPLVAGSSRRTEHVRLAGVTYRVGPEGEVVIPKELRDELGIEPGDEITFWRQDDHVALRPAGSTRPLRGRFRGSHLVDHFERERAADRRRDEAR